MSTFNCFLKNIARYYRFIVIDISVKSTILKYIYNFDDFSKTTDRKNFKIRPLNLDIIISYYLKSIHHHYYTQNWVAL